MDENIEQTNEQTVFEDLPYNRNDRFIPTEYHYDIDNKKSWKKCHCGRQMWYNDNFCPACGQKVGKPDAVYEERKE